MNEHYNCPDCNGKVSYRDEFAELDYRPRAKKGLLIPLVIIFAVIMFGAAAIFFWVNGEPDPVIDDSGVVLPDVEQKQVPNGQETDDGDAEETETEEENAEQLLPEPSTPPDYNFLEPGMHNWLVERTGDGDVILLHTDELDDVEHFFERFDIVEDNIIVYMVESKDEQFVTVLFGIPFSEWSARVVFIWRDGQWFFLREEEVN